MRMPFGRYKGESLSRVPKEYLRWLLEHTKLSKGVRTEIEQVLNPQPGRYVNGILCPEWLDD